MEYKTIMVCSHYDKESQEIKVRWHHTKLKCGVLKVYYPEFEMLSPVKQRETLSKSESQTILRIIDDPTIFPKNTWDGVHIMLKVCHGQTKKIITNRTNNEALSKYSIRFVVQLEGVKVKVEKNLFNKDVNCENTKIETIERDLFFKPTKTVIETPVLGKVIITKHALDRYRERIVAESGGKCIKCLASLAKRLSSTNLKKRKWNKEVLKHKINKYGEKEVIEQWSHQSSTMVFGTIQKNDGERVLTTVFIRKETE